MENKKYSLLVVALYCYAGHVKEMVKHLKEKNPLVDITILTEEPDDYVEIVDKLTEICFYNVSSVDWIKLRGLRVFATKYKQIRFFSKFSKNRKYDIINIHFANRYMSYVYKYLRAMSNNIVMSPWGSDIMRRPKKNLEQLSYLYQKADYITLSANVAWPIVNIVLDDFKIDPKKLVGGFWGSDLVDFAIKNGKTISQEDAKDRFGLTGQYVVTCGYNRQEAQQHKAIIEAIDKKRKQLPGNLILLFPMTYGNMTYQGKYVEEVKDECKKRNLQAIFVTDFLSVEDLYKLRKATDIFVHVQTTDAGARSVYEYILCNKKIVQGSWMNYAELESFSPLFYFPVKKLDDLGEVIVHAYNSDNIEVPQEVMDIVMNRSWENKITKMNDFFISIV
jgi:hypothetical protein